MTRIILTCDPGSGNKMAAQALAKTAMDAGEKVQLINVTRERWFGEWGSSTWLWDWGQTAGQTELLSLLITIRKTLTSLYQASFTEKMRDLLEHHKDSDTEIIIDNTQINCLNATVSAIAKHNREVTKYNIQNPDKPRQKAKMIVHFTDMPTIYAKIFSEEIEPLAREDIEAAQLEIRSKPPIIDNESRTSLSEKDISLKYHDEMKKLYPKLYGYDTSRVTFGDGPIRKEFLDRKDNPAEKQNGLSITFTNKEEFKSISSHLSFDSFDENLSISTIHFPKNAEIVSLMLGSKMSVDGTLGLLAEEITLSTQSVNTKYLFVFCGDNNPKEGLVLYKNVLEIANKVNQDPDSHIKIIPLTNQSASTIADLYSMADRIIIRPGGISVMEAETVVKKGKIILFTELGKLNEMFHSLSFRSIDTLIKYYSQQDSEKRIPDLVGWESGNALHAQNVCLDENGRTRVTLANVYTYHKELAFFETKENTIKLIQNGLYHEAFNALQKNVELRNYVATGHDSGIDLICLIEMIQLLDNTDKTFSNLIQQHSALRKLKNGPSDTLTLIKTLHENILSSLKRNENPSIIINDVLKQMDSIKTCLDKNINAVKQSDIKNKSFIIKTLEYIYRVIVNFFRFIFGLKLHYAPTADLENIGKNIEEAMKSPIMTKLKQLEDDVKQQNSAESPVKDSETPVETRPTTPDVNLNSGHRFFGQPDSTTSDESGNGDNFAKEPQHFRRE